MFFLYNIFVIITSWLLLPISLYNKKIKLFLNGRKSSFKQLSAIKPTDKVIWFHCASLGEFEQGRPIIENIKSQITNFESYKIVLTFFSPSGYKVRKNYKFADVVCYLPLDTKKNAKKFLDLVHPEIALFVKYEFWPNILNELQNRNINTLLVSAIFRKEQVFFKQSSFIKKWMQKSLKAFSHFFVQDENSKKLLNSIHFNNVTVSGDTRFDSVYSIANQYNRLDFMDAFINKKTDFVLVAGSSWKEDEDLLVDYINNYITDKQQFIIVPHAINTSDINRLRSAITKKTILFSEIKNTIDKNAKVLIIDTIGLLTKIYSYATVAYVGGGFGNGIHNILEPATFGVPIIIGPKHQKFKEANDLVSIKGCFVISNKLELRESFSKLNSKTFIKTTGNINKEYVENHKGATQCIISYIDKIYVDL